MKHLLIIAHAPSANTAALRDALVAGASSDTVDDVGIRAFAAFDTKPEDVLAAQAVILMTTENLGYMSGALKDFFDRCYYPLLDHTDALPYALLVRARQDGTGTCRAVASIASGLRWKPVQEPVVCRGAWSDSFIDQAHELGSSMAAGLEMGIF